MFLGMETTTLQGFVLNNPSRHHHFGVQRVVRKLGTYYGTHKVLHLHSTWRQLVKCKYSPHM